MRCLDEITMNDVAEKTLGQGRVSYVADENDGWGGKMRHA